MEWTTLEAHQDCLGELNVQFETVQGAELRLGAGEGQPDRERPDSRYCINIKTKVFVPADNGFTREVHVQLWITPTQIAQLVKQYFSDMLRHASPVYRDLLERLLRKRWSMMTSSIYKMKLDGLDRVEPYHHTHGI